MRKWQWAAALILVFSMGMVSCDGDVEPIGSTTVDPNNPGNPGNPVDPSLSYWPMAVGNYWTMEQDGETQPPMKITSVEQINGATYYKYDNFLGESTGGAGFTADYWTRQNGSTYSVRARVSIAAGGGMPGIEISPIEFIVLKDNLEVGQTWTETLIQTMTVTGLPPMESEVVTTGTVLAKGISFEVNGTTYQNVIQTKIVQLSMGESTESYYWYAKGVGPIQFRTVSTVDDYDETATLVAHQVN